MIRLKKLAEMPKQKLYCVAAAAIICAAIIAGVIWNKCSQSQAAFEDIPVVRTILIGNQGISQGYTYSGEVRGRYESQLAFQVNGKIISRNVQLGSIVNAGDVLMQMDAKDVAQTINSYAAQFDSAQSRLQLAESDVKRYRELLDCGAISQSQYEQYVNAHTVAAAGVRQAQAQYTQGSNQYDYTFLRADNPGVVSAITAETGQVVGAGQTVVTIVRDGEREVEINIPENRMGELRTEGKIKVSFWALPNVAVEGKVREIAPMADPVTRTFKVRISLINPPPEIKLGMTAAVTVANGDLQQTINIPLAAIYQSGDSPAVWVIEDDVLTLRPVKTGNFGNGTIQVLSGLSQGERIVTAGVHKLRQGQKVNVGGDSL